MYDDMLEGVRILSVDHTVLHLMWLGEASEWEESKEPTKSDAVTAEVVRAKPG